MSNGGQPVGKTRWKQGQFDLTRAKAFAAKKPDRTKDGPTSAEPQDIETVDVANVTCSQLTAGSSLGEVAETPQKRKGNKLAGQHCQAPKGNGVCGAVLSSHNPHSVPVCQPCAGRLAVEALHRGDSPDLDKVWKAIEAKRRIKEKADEMAARTSGVREAPSAPQSGPLAATGNEPSKVSAA